MKSKIEALGWSVLENSDGTLTLRQGSPAGEDFSFDVRKDHIVDDVAAYARSFNENEHVQLYANSSGQNGVPAFDQLVEDAKAIKEMLDRLSRKLRPKTKVISDLQLVTCCGLVGFFTNGRISRKDLPKGVYAYDFREGDDDNYFATLEPVVVVNHAGTFITDTVIDFGSENCIELDEDSSPNFAGLDLYWKDEVETLDDVAECFHAFPNCHGWPSPLSFEVSGLSSIEAQELAAEISELIRDRLNAFPCASLRTFFPTDNLGIVRWSIEDICAANEKAKEMTPEALVRISTHINASIPDVLTEYGWDVVEASVDEINE